jgi:hypothetical protein
MTYEMLHGLRAQFTWTSTALMNHVPVKHEQLKSHFVAKKTSSNSVSLPEA